MTIAALQYKIWYKANQSDSWTAGDADLFLDTLKFATAPGTPTATLSRDYGYLRRDAGVGVVAPLDLRGKWLKIVVADGAIASDGSVVSPIKSQEWYGYIPTQTDSIDGTHKSPADGTTDVSSGRTTYQAFGLDFFLRAYEIDRCYFKDASGSVQLLKRVLSFNTNSRLRNNQLVGRRTSAKPSSYPHVHDVAGTDQWTALDVVEHLLYVFKQVTGLEITLDGQYASLANVIEPWGELSGSYYQALTQLINPARGFTFYLDNLKLYVVSISDVAVGSYVPANPNQINLLLDTSGVIGSAELTNLENVHYDKIIVRGERLRVCFTMKVNPSGNTLHDGWSYGKQNQYNAATDADRAKEDFDPVFCRYVLPPLWAGMASTAVAAPIINTATGVPDTTTAQKVFRPELVLDKTIPIFDDDENGNEGRNEKVPLVWYTRAEGGSTKIYRASKPNKADLDACSVRILDDAPGFELKPKYPHFFGGSGLFTGTSSNAAKIDRQTIRATVSMYTDEHVRVEVAAQEAEPGEIEKIKIIDVPGCHYWLIVDGTTLDASESAFVTQSGYATTRNDTAILQRIAALAKVWYGRSRAAITVNCSTPYLWDRIGYVVQNAYTGGSAPTPAGTLVTAIEYDLNRLTSLLRTEWFDLDLSGMVKKRDGSGGGFHRGGAVEGQLSNQIVDAATGGSGASLYPCKLTAKTNDTTYTGDIYANGTDTTATETGVTIRVAGMATGSTLPNAVWHHAVKEKWSGADAWTLVGVPRWL